MQSDNRMCSGILKCCAVKQCMFIKCSAAKHPTKHKMGFAGACCMPPTARGAVREAGGGQSGP